MADEQIFHVGVKALISNSQDQILLLKADVSNHKTNIQPYWDIPGGRVQEGQDILDTLAREVEEEVGVHAYTQAPELVATIISKHKIPVNESLTVGLLLVVYRVFIDDQSGIILSPEHTEYEWVSALEAKQRLSVKYPTEFTDHL